MKTRPFATSIANTTSVVLSRGLSRGRYVVTAAAQYTTNHVINAIPSYGLRHAWYRYVLGWDLGPNTSVLMGQIIQFNRVRANGKRVSIDRGTVIGSHCFISTAGGLVIGQHVAIAPGVWLVTGVRDPDDPAFRPHYLPIIIDDFAYIGARSTIIGGITIGAGAVVRAGSVVLDDVEPFTVVEGAPARAVGRRRLTDPAYRLTPGPLFG